MTLERELNVALTAAELAGRYIRQAYETFVPIPDAPASITTDVDRESQEIILGHLRAAFPEDSLCAEEATPTLQCGPRDASRVWVVDPIDGTRGFAVKNGEFSVMVGLTVAGRPIVGVVLEPVTGRMTYAASGQGCWTRVGTGEPTRCRVSDRSTAHGLTLVQSRTRPGSRPKLGVRTLDPARVVETYSAGLKLAIVARGEADVYVNDYSGFHDWDVCAGQVLVEEAGGRVTLLDGAPIAYGNQTVRGGLVASNARLHDEIVNRLSAQPA